MWPFLSKLPAPFLYWTSLSSPLSVCLYSFLVILLDFCSFRSLSFDHFHSSDLLFVLWSACVSELFSLFRCPVWRKGLLFTFRYFSPKRLCLHSFHSSGFLCFRVICDLFSIYSVLPHGLLHISVFCLSLLFFCFLSIDIILPYPPDFPCHYPSVHLSKSVHFQPILVLTYTHHTLTEHFLSIMSYWDFYWNFIPWIISAQHCWQRPVLYLILCRVLYTFGV